MLKRVVEILLVACVADVAALAPSVAGAWAVAVFPSGANFGLEVMTTPVERQRGYMFRERVGPREGMLFVFEQSDVHSFWMKNCKVALDIIWLDQDFRVTEIAHDQRPCPPDGECPSILPMRTARYVLEVAAGTARREKLERGDPLVILDEPRIP